MGPSTGLAAGGRFEASVPHTLPCLPVNPIPTEVFALARRQLGVLTRSQLNRGGLTDRQITRLVASQQLVRLDQAIYCFGVVEPTWSMHAWAATLVGGRGSRLMGRSAGAIEGLCPETMPVELAVPPSHGLRSRPWLQVLRETPGQRSPSSVGAPLRTLVEDTVLDLCRCARTDAEVLGYLTTATQRLTTHRRLASALRRRTRMPHRRLIEQVLSEVATGVASPLELRWARDVERAHGLPAATRPFRLPSGAIADGAWEDYRVLLELDGRAYHDGERRFRDWRRDNLSSEGGWLTLRYGWHDTVVEPCGAAGNAARVLRRRGWEGSPQPCPRCI